MFSLGHHMNEPIPGDFYEDVEEFGTLGKMVSKLLSDLGSPVEVLTQDRPSYANASGCNGSVHACLYQYSRNFLVEIRRAGVSIGLTSSKDINYVAKIFDIWLTNNIMGSEIAKEHDFILRPDLDLYETGDMKNAVWNSMLYSNGQFNDLLKLAYADIGIRELQPQISHGRLFFTVQPGEKPDEKVEALPQILMVDRLYKLEGGPNESDELYNAFEAFTRIKAHYYFSDHNDLEYY